MAAYLKNRSISTSLNNKTPHELFYGKIADMTDLRIFGTTVMVHKPKQLRRKLDPNCTKMIFVGYDCDRKGYRCINRSNGKLCISRDVIFHENDGSETIKLNAENDDEESDGEGSDGSESVETASQSEVNNRESGDDKWTE